MLYPVNSQSLFFFNTIEKLGATLFRTLSLMKCRWVGLIGPWVQFTGTSEQHFSPTVTKTTRNGSSLSWCQESMKGCFGELAPALANSLSDKTRGEAIRTGLHWLVESAQCAGGLEGAIILQQAALESLAWLEVVVERQLCRESGFKPLPASDKIRWLLSLHNISTAIPEESSAIESYAKAFNHRDLIDVLVDVRNALVHAEPKKVERLFNRHQGRQERQDLWYQVGGVLQQALLASIGYNGLMLRRDVEAELDWAVNAVQTVPWAR